MDIYDVFRSVADAIPNGGNSRKRMRRRVKAYRMADSIMDPKSFLRSQTYCRMGKHQPVGKMYCIICEHCRKVLGNNY
jgi:hypothetical protein